MTDDIVTRLRWFTCEELNCESDVICHEAANEIERLRAEIAYLKTPCPRCDYEEEN